MLYYRKTSHAPNYLGIEDKSKGQLLQIQWFNQKYILMRYTYIDVMI